MKKFIHAIFLFYFIITPIFALADYKNSVPEGMVFIKKGCFQMGTLEKFEYEFGRINDRERPIHEICVDSFYLAKHEATQKKWEEVMKVKLDDIEVAFHGDNLPMERLHWKEANDFCTRQGHRLPTEAEWEYAARAGTTTRHFWGDEIDYDYLWFEDNSIRRPHDVGTKKPNAWGLHDMIGSVWEWVADWHSDHYYENSPRTNPKGPKIGSWHVIRGGSWVDSEKDVRSAVRYRGDEDLTSDFLVGVRCAHDARNKN